MKILFAIQGTGNGHLSRARDIYPELVQHGETDVLISGIQADVQVPFPVKYKLWGMSFIFGRHGGVDIWDTARKLKLPRLLKDINSIPVANYDLVINDFEPITSWACRNKGLPCISLSHQCAVLHPAAPRPSFVDPLGKLVLQHYAPVTASYGFHFRSYGPNIYTPVIRREVRQLTPTSNGHYTVYLPAYSDEALVQHLGRFADVRWHVFSKHNKVPFTTGNISVRPIDNKAFIESMAAASGVLCGAGFEGPAEAMYLGKKLLVVPMQAQYEQQCNAVAAADMGAAVVSKLGPDSNDTIRQWLDTGKPIQVHYPDMTSQIVADVVQRHGGRRN
jgi:uncharacterized protein (TIGR00661 family)